MDLTSLKTTVLKRNTSNSDGVVLDYCHVDPMIRIWLRRQFLCMIQYKTSGFPILKRHIWGVTLLQAKRVLIIWRWRGPSWRTVTKTLSQIYITFRITLTAWIDSAETVPLAPLGPLLITQVNFNHSINKWFHAQWNVEWNYLSIARREQLHRWSLGMDK